MLCERATRLPRERWQLRFARSINGVAVPRLGVVTAPEGDGDGGELESSLRGAGVVGAPYAQCVRLVQLRLGFARSAHGMQRPAELVLRQGL